MVSRHGLPTDVLSDNGKNFIGAKNQLEELAALERENIQENTASYGVKWHFSPSLAPHFSGVHKVMIRAAKKAIYAILSCADVTDEELLSAVVGAKRLINSRPLTYQFMNPQDPVPLTPNHFLHGQLGVSLRQTLWIVQASILADVGGKSTNSSAIFGIGG